MVAQDISRWCRSRWKRVFDLLVSLIALIVCSPVLAAITLAVRLSSPGPVLFRQMRSGRRGVPFHVLKFRTMRVDAAASGPALTQRGDPRITRLGAWLRRTKLDELPQLVNVVRGEMSLVGPRPDLPQFWSCAGEIDRDVLQLKPGVTGAASVLFRDEEQLLAGIAPEALAQHYIENVLPRKAGIELAYAAHASFWSDLRILVQTAFPKRSTTSLADRHPRYEHVSR
jgi:lipopolysaccharide/colanic/teichoic acid biosynthesis glycosyltransferase